MSNFSPFFKKKAKYEGMKGKTMAQWISESSAEQQVCVSAWITFVVRKKTGPILLVLVGLTGGREGGSETKYRFISKVLKV